MELIYSDEKHLYFGTYRKKNVYKEIFENPNIEISSFDSTSYKWIRIEGKAEILTPESVSKELKQVFHFRTSVKDEATENIIVKVHIKSVSMN